jgi:hypothetical protein
MKLKPFGSVVIEGTIYPFDTFVCWGKDITFFKSSLLELFEPEEVKIITEDIAYKQGKTLQTASKRSLIWLKTLEDCPTSFSVLNHEIFHCVTNILSTAGLELTDKSDEAWAYYIGYMTNTILNAAQK